MYNIYGINNKTDDLLLEPISIKNEDSEELEKLGELYMILNLYTMHRDKKFLPKWYKNKFNNITYDKETSLNHYKDDKYDFDFLLFSDTIENFDLKRRLKSKKRFHKCHEASLGIALNSEEDSTFVLTGYVPSISEEILHSVVELEFDNDTYIVDFTQNIMMKKDDFIKTNGFRLVTRLSASDLKKDMDVMTKLNIELPYYLLFRDEIVRDLKKNSKVLKLEY